MPRGVAAAVLAACVGLGVVAAACSGGAQGVRGDGPGKHDGGQGAGPARPADAKVGETAGPSSTGIARVDLPGPVWGRAQRPAGPARVAVVVAAGRYKLRPDWDAAFAENSGRRLAKVLVERAGFRQDDVYLLSGADVYPDRVRSALLDDAAPRLVADGSSILVYWVGHGWTDPADREPCLFTHVTKPTAAGTYENLLRLGELGAWLSELRERAAARGASLSTALVVDACRVGTLAPGGEARVSPVADLQVFSCKGAQWAQAAPGQDEALFSARFADAIERCAGRDRVMLAGEILPGLGREVADASAGSQEIDVPPWRVDIPLVLRAGISIAVRAVDPATGSDIAGARLLWNGQGHALPAALPGLREGEHWVEASAPGRFWLRRKLALDRSRDGAELRLPLVPEFVRIVGRVVDVRGDPLTGARAALAGGPGVDLAASHEFRIDVPPLSGPARMMVSRGRQVLSEAAVDPARFRVEGGDVPLKVYDLGTLRAAADSGDPGRPGSRPEAVVRAEIPVPPAPPGAPELPAELRDLLFGAIDGLARADKLTYETAARYFEQGRRSDALKLLEGLTAKASVPEPARLKAQDLAWRVRLDLAARGEADAAALAGQARATAYEHAFRLLLVQGKVRAAGSLEDALAEAGGDVGLAAWVRGLMVQRELEAARAIDRKDPVRASEVVSHLDLAAQYTDDPGRRAQLARQAVLVLREAAQAHEAAGRYAQALEALEAVRGRMPVDEWNREPKVQFERVLLAWLAQAIQAGYHDGAWDAARQVLARGEQALGANAPGLVEARQEIQRESIPPACRRDFEQGMAAYSAGDLEAAELALAAARPAANAHYGALMDKALAEIRVPLFERYFALAADKDLAGDLHGACDAILRAWEYDPDGAWPLMDLLASRPGVPVEFPGKVREVRRKAEEAARAQQQQERAQGRLIPVPAGLRELGRNAQGTWEYENAIGMKLVGIPGKPYAMGVYEVTNAEYRAYKPSYNSGKYRGQSLNGDAQPVVRVSALDSDAFCAWLSQREPGVTYRLPTEGEWEHACRAGRGDEFPWGNEWPPPKGAGNYADETAGDAFGKDWGIISGYDDGYARTSPVGSFQANPWGIYDLGGNVWEWASMTSGSARVLRGAGWRDDARVHLRVAYRTPSVPTYTGDAVGFRVLRQSGSSR